MSLCLICQQIKPCDCSDLTPYSQTAPRFGRYVHPQRSRADLRAEIEGRVYLIQTAKPGSDGIMRERGSDVAPFIFWDGEGITYRDGEPQSYVLFGASTGDYVQAKRLSTDECLALILKVEQQYPAAIHTGFAFKYDTEMILADLPLKNWFVLRKQGSVGFAGYRITYHPGRKLTVSRMVNGQRITATIYDIFSFFQQSFIKSLRAWLDAAELEDIERIEVGKAARGTFSWDQIDTVREYWRAELRLGTILCERLRERLIAAEVCPREWYGPGAIAQVLFRQHNARASLARCRRDCVNESDSKLADLPEKVNQAARFAYAGGRFELFKLGHTNSAVYQYDLNSAYPAAIATLPNLATGEWEFRENPTFDGSLFAVWRIRVNRWTVQSLPRPAPLFQRDFMGRMAYPENVSGWYWTPEASLVAGLPGVEILGAWVLHHDTSQPFAWVADMYAERQKRKAAGDPSEKGLKLALNSVYGKMAQRVGWSEGRPLPRYHQLEYAGWVTSRVRAALYRVMHKAGPNLVAVETDAVFSLTPLPLLVSNELGQWSLTEHRWITYLQSGTYWTDQGAKYRGLDPDSLTHDDALDWLKRAQWREPLVGRTTRFIGAGTGLGSPLHRCWVTEPRDIAPGFVGKRMHVVELCGPCHDGRGASEYLHPMVNMTKGGACRPHSLPWLSGKNDWQDLDQAESWNHHE